MHDRSVTCFCCCNGGGGWGTQGVWFAKHSWSSILWWRLWLAASDLLLGSSQLYCLIRGRGGARGLIVQNTAGVASFDGSCGWHQASCLCVFFLFCHSQLEKHHDHVVVAVFGIRSLCKLSNFQFFFLGGGGFPIYVVKILG